MSWPYSKADVNWFVSTPKRSKTKETNWGKSKQGKDCLQLDLSLETIEIYRPDSLRYCVRGKTDIPESYSSAFLLQNRRIRGIDFTPVPIRFMYGQRTKEIGWHENIIDYNIDPPGNDHHYSLEVTCSDLDAFHRFCCLHWNIQLREEKMLL